MRFTLLATICSALVATTLASEAPNPKPQSRVNTKQVTRQELAARANHPDLFGKRDDPQGSDSPYSCPTSTTTSSTATGTGATATATTTGSSRRRRSLDLRGLSILDARETAAFMMGRGALQWENGTTYTDSEFAWTLEDSANTMTNWYHRYYNVVRDSVGNKLLEISIPHYKKWKSTLRPGELFYLSSTTTFRSEDVDELERVLLEHPDFVDVQYQGFRINRRFFEVANSY